MCEGTNHFVAYVMTKQVRLVDWDKAVTAFEEKVDDFNIRGRTIQVPHPGYLTKFKFCVEILTGIAAAEKVRKINV